MTDDERDQMRHLFDQATNTGPATAAIDRLIYCTLLDRLTNGNLDLALSTFAEPGTHQAALRELEELNDDERTELVGNVVPMWNEALSLAIRYLWHVSRTLGYNPEGLDPKHVALVGTMFLGADFTHLADAEHPVS